MYMYISLLAACYVSIYLRLCFGMNELIYVFGVFAYSSLYRWNHSVYVTYLYLNSLSKGTKSTRILNMDNIEYRYPTLFACLYEYKHYLFNICSDLYFVFIYSYMNL